MNIKGPFSDTEFLLLLFLLWLQHLQLNQEILEDLSDP